LPRRTELDQPPLGAVSLVDAADLVQLEPLDEPGAAELSAAGWSAPSPAPALLRPDRLDAAGNPLFVREIVQALVRDKAVVVTGGRGAMWTS